MSTSAQTPPSQVHHHSPSPATSPLAKRPKTTMASPNDSQTTQPPEGAPPKFATTNNVPPQVQPSQGAPPTSGVATKLPSPYEKKNSQSSGFEVQKLKPFTHPALERGSDLAAGYDIRSAYEMIIPKNGRAVVRTELAMAIPVGTYGRIAPRSGLAVKKGIATGAGVIDPDYRGEVMVLLFNHGDEDFQIKEGDRIAQLILEKIYTPEVEVVEKLGVTVRGAGGFGSTGSN